MRFNVLFKHMLCVVATKTLVAKERFILGENLRIQLAFGEIQIRQHVRVLVDFLSFLLLLNFNFQNTTLQRTFNVSE